jgi:hypothetical protein
MWYTIPAVTVTFKIISSDHPHNAKTRKVCEKIVEFLGASKATAIEAVAVGSHVYMIMQRLEDGCIPQ